MTQVLLILLLFALVVAVVAGIVASRVRTRRRWFFAALALLLAAGSIIGLLRLPPGNTSAPVPTTLLLYAADQQTGEVVAYSARDGAVRWRHVPATDSGSSARGSVKTSAPVLAGAVVYVTSMQYPTAVPYVPVLRVVALGAADGATRWSVPLAGQPIGTPIIADGAVYLAYVDETPGQYGLMVTALRASDGGALWSVQVGSGTPSYASQPLAAENGLVAVNSGEQVVVLHAADGSTAWSAALGTYGFFRYQAFGVSLQEDSGTLYLRQTNGALVALDLATGTQRWAYPLDGAAMAIAGPLAIADGAVYFAASTYANADGTGRQMAGIYALRASDGTLLWRQPIDSAPTNGVAPAVADGVVYAGTQGWLYALRASDGGVLWRYGVGTTRAVGQPALSDGVIFAISQDTSAGQGGPPAISALPSYRGFDLFALKASDGSVYWRVAVDGVTGQLAAMAADG